MKKQILFYLTNKPYGCFSNFYVSEFELKGFIWKTTEHYFQAMKFEGTKHFMEVHNTNKPMEAAIIGRDRNRPLRKNWEDIKDSIMYEAIKAKFDSNLILKNILLSTGNCQLIEHTSNDRYWADGGDGMGQNKLGKLLMKLRDSYEEYDGKFYLPQWVVYPKISPSDMFWRMGVGEDYIYKLYAWAKKWGNKATQEYKNYFIPPKEWNSEHLW